MRAEALRPFGAVLSGISAGGSSEAELRAFEDAFREHSLVVVRGPGMPEAGQRRLLERLAATAGRGPADLMCDVIRHEPGAAGEPQYGAGELMFHFEFGATPDWPYEIMSLYGEEVTESGGETRFAHGGLGLARLPEAVRRAVRGLSAVHVFDPYKPIETGRPDPLRLGRYAERAVHEAVRAHPYGRGEALTVSFATTLAIVGLSRERSDALLERLYETLYSDEAVYSHAWRRGDLVVWDNRLVQHARTDFDRSRRRSVRRVIAGDTASIKARFRRWVEQARVEKPNAALYARGSILSPGDPGVWYGMLAGQEPRRADDRRGYGSVGPA